MTIISTLHKKVCALGQKLNAENMLLDVNSVIRYPELGALASAGKGLSRISNLRNNVDCVRQLTQ